MFRCAVLCKKSQYHADLPQPKHVRKRRVIHIRCHPANVVRKNRVIQILHRTHPVNMYVRKSCASYR